MENLSGIKELYDVSIRLNKPLKIGEREYDINESILSFSKIEMAQVNQQKNEVVATGGYGNSPLVNWELDKEIVFFVTHGVLSPKSWALISNSKMKESKYKSIQYYEELRTIEDEYYCFTDLKYCPNCCERLGAQPNPNFESLPMGRREELMLKPLPPSKTKWIFIYDNETGQRIRDFSIYNNRIFFKESYRNISVDYTFTYNDKIRTIEIGDRLFNGFLRMSGKMSVKDRDTGEISTAIIEIPKVKISSNLSIRLGSSYDSSTVSDFYFKGFLDENDKSRKIAQITFLDKELTGDYI